MGLAVPFQPKLIVLQIVALQCGWYVFATLSLFLFNTLFLTRVSLGHVFTDEFIETETIPGWVEILHVMLCALACSVLLVVVVERSRQCLDFSVTLYFIHVCACTFYGGRLPRGTSWWVTHGVALVLTVVLGEYLCSRRELSEIPLAGVLT
jgi:hypothetical protein